MSEWHTRQNSSTLNCSRVNISRPLPLWPLAMAPALETFTSRSSRRYGGNIKTVAIVRDSFPPGLRLPSFQVLILDSDGQNLPFPPSPVKPHQSASSNTDWNSANSACLQSMRILQWHCWLHTDPLSEGETRTVQCPGYNGVQRLSRGQTSVQWRSCCVSCLRQESTPRSQNGEETASWWFLTFSLSDETDCVTSWWRTRCTITSSFP